MSVGGGGGGTIRAVAGLPRHCGVRGGGGPRRVCDGDRGKAVQENREPTDATCDVGNEAENVPTDATCDVGNTLPKDHREHSNRQEVSFCY